MEKLSAASSSVSQRSSHARRHDWASPLVLSMTRVVHDSCACVTEHSNYWWSAGKLHRQPLCKGIEDHGPAEMALLTGVARRQSQSGQESCAVSQGPEASAAPPSGSLMGCGKLTCHCTQSGCSGDAVLGSRGKSCSAFTTRSTGGTPFEKLE